MKYRLTKEAIEELKAMEFSMPRSMFVMEGMGDMRRILAGEWIFEEIKLKLSKPRLKSVEDLKALEGWEASLFDDDWYSVSKYDNIRSIQSYADHKIRQIDMPENEYLVKDCIEQEIEVGDIAKHEGGFIGLVQSIWGSDPVEVELGNRTDEYCYHLNDCKLIRKASEITQSDREKYLGEKAEEPNIWKGAYKEPKEPISIADYQAHKDREFEAKVREIIKKVLKEEAGE